MKINYSYLRPLKAKALIKWHESSVMIREQLNVWLGQNATILPKRGVGTVGLGGVVDCNGQVVDLSTTPPHISTAYDAKATEFRDEKVVYCGYLIHHWGHFLMDATARLWYFLKNDESIDKYVFVIDENEQRDIKGNYKEFLSLLKIWDKIEIINKPVKYREVVVPELSFRNHRYYSDYFLAVFDSVIKNANADPTWRPIENIYFSRSKLKKQQKLEFGMEVLDHFFAQNHYTVLYPEQIPLRKMIFYMQNVKNVASISGSPLHNILFGRRNQKMTIFERCAVNNEWQVSVNRMMDLDITYVDANISIYPVAMSGPFIVGCNDILLRYAQDMQMIPPKDTFRSKRFYRKCFVRYMRAYKKQYGYMWFMPDYLIRAADYHVEAFEDCLQYFGLYLKGVLPFRWHHYLTPHYWKAFLKFFLQKTHKIP